MFIDVRATKLMNNPFIVDLVDMARKKHLTHLHDERRRTRIALLLRDAHEHHLGGRSRRAPLIINRELTEHVTMGVVVDSDVSINGSYREKFCHHNQLHVDDIMAILSVAYKTPSETIGLLIPNTEARNPLYFDVDQLFDFLDTYKVTSRDDKELRTLLAHVVELLKKRATLFSHKDARTCIRFMRVAMGFISGLHYELPHINPKTKLLLPATIFDSMDQGKYAALFPFVIRTYLEVCKRDGNYALGTHHCWNI